MRNYQHFSRTNEWIEGIYIYTVHGMHHSDIFCILKNAIKSYLRIKQGLRLPIEVQQRCWRGLAPDYPSFRLQTDRQTHRIQPVTQWVVLSIPALLCIENHCETGVYCSLLNPSYTVSLWRRFGYRWLVFFDTSELTDPNIGFKQMYVDRKG